jgi:ATP-binding protein involved in chromosome partitioning
MPLSVEEVREALRKVRFPGLGRDIVSFGFVKNIEVSGGEVRVEIAITTANPDAAPAVERQARLVLEALPGVSKVEVDCASKPPQAPEPAVHMPRPIPGIRATVAVASGKGGVGKSTVAANLAVALAGKGLRVGLLDADIYGPSQHLMMGASERPWVNEREKIMPPTRHGVRLMSLGFIVDPDQPVIWRGPMVMKALQQLLQDVEWGELDVLVIDLPPGTGDAQLTITQELPLSGAVIVTTPQDVALIDARKGLAMFQKMDVPVLGIIENMSVFVCPQCGHREPIFGAGGGERTAHELQVPFLGGVPIDPAVVTSGDTGTPIVVAAPGSAAARAFAALADTVASRLNRLE